MTTDNANATRLKRLYFLDNLRTTIIFLVVLYHAGGVYESAGTWASFWIVDDPDTNNISGIVGLVVDIFMMSTLFFISGYLAPPSLKSKTARQFLVSKFRRLMIPWMVAVLTLIPLYKVIFLYSRNLPQEQWTTYFHFSSGNISSQNWLWFLPVLFLFNLLYLLFAGLNVAPARIPFKLAVATVFAIGVAYSFGMEFFHLTGWTLTPLLDFQNERILIYFLMFLLGTLGYQQQLFTAKPSGNALYITVTATSWVPINIYVWFLLLPWIVPGTVFVTPIADRVILWLSFHLSLLSLMYLMIESFRRYVDRTGPLWDALNQNSYYVYIIHVVVLGGIALILRDTTLPSMAKYLTLAVSTYLVSTLMISLVRLVLSRRNAVTLTPKLSRGH